MGSGGFVIICDFHLFGWRFTISVRLCRRIYAAKSIFTICLNSIQFLIFNLKSFSLQIRTTGVTIILVLLSVSAFVSVKVFPILLESQDVHGCFMVYAIGSVAGALFVHFVMEETKGKALDDDVGLDEKFKMENHDIEKM